MAFSKDWSGQLIGDYRLLRRLGGGGFGEVYQAEEIRERRPVAVKLLKAPLTAREDLKAFLNEARAIRLVHPHIVPLLDFGLSEQDLPFLVMEYLSGGTLRDHYPRGSRVPLATVVKLTHQVASALQYAHGRHQVHRDVKPENMLRRADGTVLLSDFGIATVAHASESVSAYQAFGGTLPYMAPEQHEGHPRPASDQYALAVVVYEWLAGVRPFVGTAPELVAQHLSAPPPSLVARVPELPVEVEQVVFKALAKKPQERFARVEDFAVALEGASQPTTLPASAVPFAPPPPQQSAEPSSMPDQASASLPTEQSAEPPSMLEQALAPSMDRADDSSSTEASPASPAASIPASPPGKASAPPPFTPASTRPTLPKAVPSSHAPRAPTPGPQQTTPRNRPGRDLLLACGLLLVTLGGSGLLFLLGSPWFRAEHPQWSFDTGSPTDVSPVTAGGMLYLSSAEGTLYVFDAACHASCQPLWSFATGDGALSLAIAKGMLYVSSSDKFYAFDAACHAHCQPLWSFAIDGIFGPLPLVVAGGMVYVSLGELYVFDAACRQHCQPLWSFAPPQPSGSNLLPSFGYPLTVAGGMVYIASNENILYAFDATCRQHCQPLWSFSMPSTASSTTDPITPVVAGGMVYIISQEGILYAFDATCRQHCQPLWSFATGSSYFSAPVVAGGMVYVNSEDGYLYAFNATCRAHCRPLWSFTTSPDGGLASTPVVAGKMLYVGSDYDKLYVFDVACRAHCQPLWSFAPPTPSAGNNILTIPPIVAEGMVYVSPSRGSLFYAFDATCRQHCQPKGSFYTGDIITGDIISSPPTVADGMVYIGSEGGKLYAFGLAS